MRSLFSLLFMFWAGTSHALCTGASFIDRITDEERIAITSAAAQTPYASGIFWTAEKNEKTLHVIGTMHMTDPRLDPVFATTKDALQFSEILLVEATDEDEERMQATFAEKPEMIYILDGPTLPEQLDEQTWEALAEAASARMLPPFLAAKMQPWFLSLTLSIPPCLIAELASGAPGLDHMLMAEAEANGIPLAAVEDPLDMINAMRSGTMEEQLEMLRLSILAPDLQSEMFVAMLDSYFNEDIAEIWEMSRVSASYVPGLDAQTAEDLLAKTEEQMLTTRNLAWIPVVNSALESVDAATLAVGAAHLPGEFGVLQLLENEGWALTRQK